MQIKANNKMRRRKTNEVSLNQFKKKKLILMALQTLILFVGNINFKLYK